MVFTSFDFAIFLLSVLILYWLLPFRKLQNVLLLIASYIFYGYIHPWFCILIAASTVVDYFCGLGMTQKPDNKKLFLVASVVFNLSLLGFFKYFNFFMGNISELLDSLGVNANIHTLKILLPVGISFYTFQTLSYTIDIYRGKLEARKSFIDFALFVSFFPQLVAGPIERASHFLPQVERKRTLATPVFYSAIMLFVRGYIKKLLVADNVSVFVDKVFMLDKPSIGLLLAGTVAFAIQIYMDFSAYTDIARASARLLGFELMENFNQPYLAISPSDFWKRWHISFSSWIRDYLYIPLGGSRVDSRIRHLMILLVSLGLSGLWHGARWNFVIWGVYHAVIIFVYHSLGMASKWQPKTNITRVLSWGVMSCITLVGWMIFRCTNISWLIDCFARGDIGLSGQSLVVVAVIIIMTAVYLLPLVLISTTENFYKKAWLQTLVYTVGIVVTVLLHRNNPQDFIYFQF